MRPGRGLARKRMAARRRLRPRAILFSSEPPLGVQKSYHRPLPARLVSLPGQRRSRRYSPHAKPLQHFGAPGSRLGIDARIEALAMAVHGNEQGPETVDTELPQRLRVQV